MKKSLNLPDFDVVYLGKRLFELTLKTPFYIEQTGAAVTKTYKIPFAHRLVKVEVKHTDSADADSGDALDWSFHRQWTNIQLGTLWLEIKSYAASALSDFIEKFGEAYEFPDMLYKFVTDTTNTDRIYLKLTIQLLE